MHECDNKHLKRNFGEDMNLSFFDSKILILKIL